MGVKELIAERKTEWFAEGAYNKAVSTAKKLLAMKILSDEQIAQATNLSVEEVAAL